MKIIVNDDEPLEIPLIKRPITEGRVEVPKPIDRRENLTNLEKKIIAIDAVESNLSQKDLADIHGVTQPSISVISRAHNVSNIDTRKTDSNLKAVINQSKFKIADLATSRLMTALDLFDPAEIKQSELPDAANKMAAIVERVTQGFEGQQANQVNFIVYAPRMRSEESYEVVEGDVS